MGVCKCLPLPGGLSSSRENYTSGTYFWVVKVIYNMFLLWFFFFIVLWYCVLQVGVLIHSACYLIYFSSLKSVYFQTTTVQPCVLFTISLRFAKMHIWRGISGEMPLLVILLYPFSMIWIRILSLLDLCQNAIIDLFHWFWVLIYLVYWWLMTNILMDFGKLSEGPQPMLLDFIMHRMNRNMMYV